MSHNLQFYIDGVWVQPETDQTQDLIDPSTEKRFANVALGSVADVDKAVAAAKRAFATFGFSAIDERLALLSRIIEIYKKRSGDLAFALSREMGAPRQFALDNQVAIGLAHLQEMVTTLSSYQFYHVRGLSRVYKEPIGVVGLITPWNWPLNQITSKVAPAIAAGCTMVLKPSEIAPLNAIIFAEIMDEANVPKGVFNLVNGDGPTVGTALASHPDVDMVSFTGSTRAGILVAKNAADTVKRVHQELGGKSANILLPDADFSIAVPKGVRSCFGNSGQSCDAPTRMFVPRDKHEEVCRYAKEAAEKLVVGQPDAPSTNLGPVVSRAQYDKIQNLIESGIAEGAKLVAGGPGKPPGIEQGFYVRPTVFSEVKPDMRIAREEVFGPVLVILPYDSVDEAIDQANDTVYGLATYIQSNDIDSARAVAARVRSGNVYINHAAWDAGMPFGGYKQSGNGRECGQYGLEDYLEIKGIVGYGASESATPS